MRYQQQRKVVSQNMGTAPAASQNTKRHMEIVTERTCPAVAALREPWFRPGSPTSSVLRPGCVYMCAGLEGKCHRQWGYLSRMPVSLSDSR